MFGKCCQLRSTGGSSSSLDSSSSCTSETKESKEQGLRFQVTHRRACKIPLALSYKQIIYMPAKTYLSSPFPSSPGFEVFVRCGNVGGNDVWLCGHELQRLHAENPPDQVRTGMDLKALVFCLILYGYHYMVFTTRLWMFFCSNVECSSASLNFH